MKYTYLLINFFTILVPFIFSFHPRIRFYLQFPAFIKASFLASVPFLLWDILFTANNVWSFNPEYTLGIRLIGLPLEEILFFFCIPFSCVFTYHCVRLFYPAKWNVAFGNIFVLILAGFLILVGFIFFKKAYTVVTCLSTAFLLLLFRFYFKATWLDQLFSVYPLLLIPFFIVNGLLTGTGLDNAVVSYNNQENVGIRLMTIPVEDVFYGFELILLNLFFYEYFISQKDAPA